LLTTVKKAVLSACQMGLAFWKLSNAVGPVTGFCNYKSESWHQLCGQTQTHRQTERLSNDVGLSQSSAEYAGFHSWQTDIGVQDQDHNQNIDRQTKALGQITWVCTTHQDPCDGHMCTGNLSHRQMDTQSPKRIEAHSLAGRYTENRGTAKIGRTRWLTAKAVMLARVARMEVLLAKICASAASRMLLPYWSPPVTTQDTVIEEVAGGRPGSIYAQDQCECKEHGIAVCTHVAVVVNSVSR